MLLIHPVIQCCFILLATLAFVLGANRFRSQHLGHKARFRWKAHVAIGKAATFGLFLGASVGMWAARDAWGRSFMTMGHGKMGVALLCLLSIGAATGYQLNRVKKKCTFLPLLHASVNTAALGLAFNQIRTGIEVYNLFVSGL